MKPPTNYHKHNDQKRRRRRRPGAPTTSPSLPRSPRGAAMAMVIMSPLSELTDTDGFEMHSVSQRASALPTPSSSMGLSGPSVLGVGLPWSDGKAKFSSTASQQLSEETIACLTGGYVRWGWGGGSSESLLNPYWWYCWCTAAYCWWKKKISSTCSAPLLHYSSVSPAER